MGLFGQGSKAEGIRMISFTVRMTFAPEDREEIAEILECPLGTVKSRIFHGLAALRRILDHEGEEARQFPDFPSEDLCHAV